MRNIDLPSTFVESFSSSKSVQARNVGQRTKVTVKYFESQDLEIGLSLYLAQRVRRSMNETTDAATSIKDSPVLLIEDRVPRVGARKPKDVGK